MIPIVSGWTCDRYPAADSLALADALSLSPAAAAILARRGLGDVESARAFLTAGDRHEPALLHGMAEACALVLEHAAKGSRIVVFGDYDVDGVCSTAIAIRALRAVGVVPDWRLPSREEGYGLSEGAVRELVAKGAGLILTVDCGVTATDEVALAKSLGVDVVVTDHHRPGAELPGCPVVHPALGGYPFGELCGAGVALKLSEALRGAAGVDPAGAEEDLDLAALATLCDMVPLVGENRRIARAGLAALARTSKVGLRALMGVAALDPGDVDERSVGFRLGPRINAAGRLQRADAALELLLAEDRDRADEIARELDGLNSDRRETEQRIAREAEALCVPQLSAASIVVAGEGWHPGVVGIVASRLVERHRRPCVVIALDNESGRGSGRSIDPYDLHAGLAAASGELVRFGGHRMAAGVEIEADRVEPFRAALAAHAGAALTPHDLVRVQRAHAVVPAGALTIDLAEQLERLGPFGAGNPAPVLMVPAARVEHVTAMGKEREHARFTLASGAARARGVAFRTSQSALADAGASPQDVAVTLEQNRWNGAVEARVVLRALSPTRAGEIQPLGSESSLVEAVERELAADPAEWWPDTTRVRAAAAAEPVQPVAEFVPPAAPAVLPRPRLRHGEGFAGLVGDLLTSGESLLVVVADVDRRHDGLARLIAGLSPGQLPVVAWETLAAEPELAKGFRHLVALDPPPTAEGLSVLDAARHAAATAGSPHPVAHLAWAEPERAFTLACWRERLDLRPALIELWRALDAAGALEGDALAAALRGTGAHPRQGSHCGRLVRVLCELDLAAWEPASPRLVRAAGQRTELDRSPAHRAYAARLAAVERHLAVPGPERARVAS